ncbi:MAG TPA: hypothetical protein DEH02_15945 [Bacteroidales bacterium]|nr:MAG: hypothetical protein A2X01_18380 [Bacteroidetes bacterium GWF2_35_48]OFZ03989.1 MAG: hypothetical protein A2491_07210 [Bacteroidetes bacterium RIFOXYC12_FULL_35_7]HBX52556.1 hypothetical protein [Bacteroidales bacterium]
MNFRFAIIYLRILCETKIWIFRKKKKFCRKFQKNVLVFVLNVPHLGAQGNQRCETLFELFGNYYSFCFN